MRAYILIIIAAVLFTACSKANYDVDTAYAELSFYNASYTLDAFLPANAGSRKQVLIPLTPNSKESSSIGNKTPFFTQDQGGARQDYPAVNWLFPTPWMVFDHYAPGTYTANILTDTTNKATSFTFTINAERNKRMSCFISDSLGTFHNSLLVHDAKSAPGKVSLRLVQLCPDADSVNLRIGNNLMPGIQNQGYGSISSSVNYALSADTLLKLRLFNAGDTLNVIGRYDLDVKPGQSFVLVLRHYRNNHQYTDKNGQQVNIIAGGILEVRKVE